MPTTSLVKAAFAAAAALPLAVPASLASAAPVTVAYQILGSGKAVELVYWDETGTKQTEHNVPLPWSKTVSIAKTIPIHLDAIVSSGEVTCKIAVNGKPIAETKRQYSTKCATDIAGS